MRVIILAGGKGIRLAPLTEVIPKPLVPIGGMPILEIVIRQLKDQGFHKITLAVGYLAELIKAYFRDGSQLGVEIDYSHESNPLGTAGPLALIKGLDDTFMVMNADVMTNINYRDLLKYHKSHDGIATIAAFEYLMNIDLGVIIKDGDARIKDYLEKPSNSYLVSMGVYIFEPEVLKFVPDHSYLDFPDLVKKLLEHNHSIYFYHFKGYWLDIGRHDDFAKANNEFKIMQEKYNSIPNRLVV